jgi:hypothetical protein
MRYMDFEEWFKKKVNKDMGDLANSTEGNFKDSDMMALSDLWEGRKANLKEAWYWSALNAEEKIIEILEELNYEPRESDRELYEDELIRYQVLNDAIQKIKKMV